MEYIELVISTIFVNNILLAQFLGNCPFLGTSKKMETAAGMAMAVIFVLVMAGVMTWVIYEWMLVPYKLEFLRTIAFILVIASLVQFVEMFLKKEHSRPLCRAGHFPAADHHQLRRVRRLRAQYRQRIQLHAIAGSLLWLRIRLWSGLGSFCRRARAHPAGTRSQAVAGYLHCSGYGWYFFT